MSSFFNEKTDIWAAGVVITAILTFKLPFTDILYKRFSKIADDACLIGILDRFPEQVEELLKK